MSTAAPDRSAVYTLLLNGPALGWLFAALRDVNFLRSDSKCRRCVSNLVSNVTPRYLGSEQKGRVLLL